MLDKWMVSVLFHHQNQIEERRVDEDRKIGTKSSPTQEKGFATCQVNHRNQIDRMFETVY